LGLVAAAARLFKAAGVAMATAVAAAEFLMNVRREGLDESMSSFPQLKKRLYGIG
jgi:hypothetical protein